MWVSGIILIVIALVAYPYDMLSRVLLVFCGLELLFLVATEK